MVYGCVRDLRPEDNYFSVGRWRSLESHSLGMGGGAGRCQRILHRANSNPARSTSGPWSSGYDVALTWRSSRVRISAGPPLKNHKLSNIRLLLGKYVAAVGSYDLLRRRTKALCSPAKLRVFDHPRGRKSNVKLRSSKYWRPTNVLVDLSVC